MIWTQWANVNIIVTDGSMTLKKWLILYEYVEAVYTIIILTSNLCSINTNNGVNTYVKKKLVPPFTALTWLFPVARVPQDYFKSAKMNWTSCRLWKALLKIIVHKRYVCFDLQFWETLFTVAIKCNFCLFWRSLSWTRHFFLKNVYRIYF